FEPIWGGLFFAVSSSILISRLSRNTKMKADTMTGILWSFGMALGILFIALAPGYMPDMTSYLFGDILSVSNNSLVFMAIFTVVITVTFLMLYNHLIIYLFDEEYARARGINTTLLEWIVYIMIPIGIIVLIKVVGIILTIALMTIPVSIAKLFCKSINRVIILSAILSAAFSITGLVLSYYLNIPSGACIIIFSTLVYLITLAVKHRIQKSLHEKRVHGDD
ncbi:MAG: metal ABC transporter permease, partial [Clostridia bacterium]|nr:metal ABC transporter permease [Clostridia bacterium]